MRYSQHSVSLGTFALAFAVVLSPAFLQTEPITCATGDTTLSLLELEVSGENQIVGFNPSVRSYDVSTSSYTAVLRVQSVDPGAALSYYWWTGQTTSGVVQIGVGSSEVTVNVPVGQSSLRVVVRAPGGLSGPYIVNVTGPDGLFPCTEQGILDAIALGGGPYTFDCDGPTTVDANILIDNDVILDGEGNLTLKAAPVQANESSAVGSGVTAELRRFTLSSPDGLCCSFPPIVWPYICPIYNRVPCPTFVNVGTLILAHSNVPGPGPVRNLGTLTVADSTASVGMSVTAGVFADSTLMVTNSTVVSIYCDGGLATVTNSTVAGIGANVWNMNGGTVTLANTIIEGECVGDAATSLGYNIESPGNTCGFDQEGDQFDVTPTELNLGPLQDNGGPTETHALGAGSFAINQIPAGDCGVTTDQRGEPRPETGGTMCDVGAFEVQP